MRVGTLVHFRYGTDADRVRIDWTGLVTESTDHGTTVVLLDGNGEPCDKTFRLLEAPDGD